MLQEGNIFWFTNSPENYVKLMEGQLDKDYSSIKSLDARCVVRHWHYRCRKPSRTMGEWEKGWNLLKASAQEEQTQERDGNAIKEPSHKIFKKALLDTHRH